MSARILSGHGLRGGQFETQLREKRFIKRLSPAHGNASTTPQNFYGATGSGIATPQTHPTPIAARDFHVRHFFGKMNHADGVRARGKYLKSNAIAGSVICVSNFSSARQMSVRITRAVSRSVSGWMARCG